MKKIQKLPRRRYDWKPDLPDHRDYLFALTAPAPTKLPSRVDLRASCSPVMNQGQIGSCTGNSLAGALEFLEIRELRDGSGAEVFDPNQFDPISRLFIYYSERSLEGTTAQDGGGMLRDGVKALTQWGSCRERTWKYTKTNVLKKPTGSAYKEAGNHLISTYLRILSLTEMKQCLASGFPFVFGFSVYESFESPSVAKSGIAPMPLQNESLVGGHAVMAAGYDDAKKMLLVRNSWGPDWGQDGYFWLPYAYVSSPRLAQDFWTIRK